MAASKDNEKEPTTTKDTAAGSTGTTGTASTSSDSEPKAEKEPKSLAGSYKLLRGSFSTVAPKDMKRQERLVPNGPLVTVEYKKGERIRYSADAENLSTMELTHEQAGRFLNNPTGGKITPPRVEKV